MDEISNDRDVKAKTHLEKENKDVVQVVKEWFLENNPEEIIKQYLLAQSNIFSTAGREQYARTANPNTREICEMTVCEVCRSLVPAPEGFEPISDRKTMIYDEEGKPIKSVVHMFFYNREKDLIFCLSPAQFIDDQIPGMVESKIVGRKGNRIKIQRSMAEDSSILFIESPNDSGNYVMVGHPDEIKQVLGLDYFFEKIDTLHQYPHLNPRDPFS